MIKQDIVERLAERSGVSENTAERVFDALFNSMKGALARGWRIELRGFGVFTVGPRKSGMCRNPSTGEQVPIPVGKTVRFKPGKELRPREKDTP
ncbi:MAG TPA: HU family DNA-binding protein [Pyrinomonadaceae bacterium]|nr:HU family DNA-binding protein [Pyrinomonadaceae bacterium]